MQTEQKEGEQQFGAGVVTCPNCHAEMVAGLRFCRRCGFRLGEGVEEYTETRRFDGSRPPFAPPAPSASKDAPPYAQPNAWTHAPMAPMTPMSPMAPLATMQPAAAKRWCWTKMFKPWRWGWVGWVVLSLVIMVAVGSLVNNSRGGAGVGGGPSRQRSYLGVDGFETAEGGGAMLTGIAGPDTPALRAGLIGGDVIKSFDGKPVEDDDDLRRLLRSTPAGKAVEVVYVRDGETRTGMLTTGNERDSEGSNAFDLRPGGKGFLGINPRAVERVRVPSLNIYGVELGGVHRNGPADIAGLKEGDIVVEFNGHPVRTEGDLRYRIYEAVPGETIKVVVVRAGQLMDVMVKMGRSRDDDD